MNSSEERETRPTEIKQTLDISNPIDIGEKSDIVKSGENNASLSSSEANAPPDSERAKLQWEFEKFLANFTSFLDLGLKAVGLFYAVLGGILSIYFAKDSANKDVVKFLLYAPLIMSLILSLTFFIGAWTWRSAIPNARNLAKRLEMTTTPKFELLTWLLFVFGLTFVATGLGLLWLINRLV